MKKSVSIFARIFAWYEVPEDKLVMLDLNSTSSTRLHGYKQCTGSGSELILEQGRVPSSKSVQPICTATARRALIA
jgi:hypothetical protein